jgi:hypothetical protein
MFRKSSQLILFLNHWASLSLFQPSSASLKIPQLSLASLSFTSIPQLPPSSLSFPQPVSASLSFPQPPLRLPQSTPSLGMRRKEKEIDAQADTTKKNACSNMDSKPTKLRNSVLVKSTSQYYGRNIRRISLKTFFNLKHLCFLSLISLYSFGLSVYIQHVHNRLQILISIFGIKLLNRHRLGRRIIRLFVWIMDKFFKLARFFLIKSNQ